MKLDTSSYYPKSPLDDDPELQEALDSVEPTVSREVGAEFDPQESESVTETVPAAVAEPELPPSEGETVVTYVANFLSWVLVPLLMPVYGVALAFGLSILAYIPYGTRLLFTAIVAGFNIVIPAIVIALLKKANVVNDIGLNDRKERFIPYLVSIICLAGTGFFMYYKGAPMWLVMFFFGGTAAGVVEVIINNWWKISVHAAGMAGIVALLVHMEFSDVCAPATETWLLIAISLTGLLGAARIWLRRHTLGQVMAGYAVGFCAVYFMMMIQ